MHYIVTFESDSFDLAGEDPNPINPIHGQSVGLWMSPLLESQGVDVGELDVEDWGWYMGATFEGRDYLMGFVGHPGDETDNAPELIVQVDKHRSLLEKITRQEKMDASDPLLSLIVELIRGLEDARHVQIHRVP